MKILNLILVLQFTDEIESDNRMTSTNFRVPVNPAEENDPIKEIDEEKEDKEDKDDNDDDYFN